MLLRFALVSVVAVLGMTLPSRRDVETWGRGAERWMSTRLAQLDSRSSIRGSTFVSATEFAFTEAPHDEVAATPTTAVEPVAPTPTLAVAEPEIVATQQYQPPRAAVSDEAFATVVEEMALRFAGDVPPVPAIDSEQLADVQPPADVIAAPAAPIAVAAVEVFSQTVTDEELAFDASIEEIVVALARESKPSDPVADADRAFAGVVDEMAVAFTADLVALRKETAVTVIVMTSDESYADAIYADDLYAGESDDSNEVATVAIEASTEAPVNLEPENRLTNAVRLTRDAVFAWGSLLHGPAMVTIPR